MIFSSFFLVSKESRRVWRIGAGIGAGFVNMALYEKKRDGREQGWKLRIQSSSF